MVSPKDTCNNTDLKRISFNAVFIYTTSVIIDQKLTIHVDIDIAPLKFSANFQSWTTVLYSTTIKLTTNHISIF